MRAGEEIPLLFCGRAASHRVAAKIPLYHALRILSSEICEKTAQSCIPKLVQNYLLTFLKTFAIIYLQGKERGKQKKEKNLKKPLDKPKSLWYNKDKIKEGQRNRNKVVGRAKRLLIT